MIQKLLRRIHGRFWNGLVSNPHYQLFGEFHYRINTNLKVVALTYDDGPVAPYTAELLETLKKYKVRATFFFVGRNIEEYNELALRTHSDGHQIGNHSYSHPKMVFRSLRFLRREIEATDYLIRSLGVNYRIDFRAPYGMKLLGLPYTLWRMSKRHILFDFFPKPRDWWGADPEEVVASMVKQTKPGSIIILHDGNPNAGPLVSKYTALLIEQLTEKGYQFKTVNELIELQSKGA